LKRYWRGVFNQKPKKGVVLGTVHRYCVLVAKKIAMEGKG
jgi:hypothetical protein